MKTLAFLSIAQNTDPNNKTTSHGEDRVHQYLDGIAKFFQYPKVEDFDVVIIDNKLDTSNQFFSSSILTT